MIDNKFYKIVDFIFKLLLLNFTFFFGVIIGGVVAGIFPATIALVRSLEKLSEEEAVTLLKEYVYTYKNFFFKANLIGGLSSLLFLGAFINYRVLVNSPSLLFEILRIFLFIFASYVGLSLLNGLLLNSKLGENTYKQKVIESCIYTFVNLKHSLLQIGIFVTYLFVLVKIPTLFLFGGTSLLFFLEIKIFNHAISKTVEKLILNKEV